MMSSRLWVLLCLALLASFALAEDQVQEEEDTQEGTGLSTIQLPVGELTVSDSFLRAVGMAGAVVTGVAGLAAILSLILPMVGLRTCALLGSCDTDNGAYNPATNSVYDHQQGFNGYQYNSGFKKRSLEYVGPILKALTTAYDKYGPPAQHRKGAAKVAENK